MAAAATPGATTAIPLAVAASGINSASAITSSPFGVLINFVSGLNDMGRITATISDIDPILRGVTNELRIHEAAA